MSHVTFADKVEGTADATGKLTAADVNEIKAAINSKAAALGDDDNYVTDAEKAAIGTIADKQDELAEGTFDDGDKTKLDGIEAQADVTDVGNVGSTIHGVPAKATPVDADTMPIIDSAALNVLKKVTWANIKATLKAYFDTLYGDVVLIASGAATIGTAEIANNACASVITVSATGVATTDVIDIGYNSTPVGKTGYDPTSAELTVRAFPTTDNINILVCNRTGAAVTPAAMTINWRVVR